MPMAVMRRDILGEERSGLYATFSMVTPKSVHPRIEAATAMSGIFAKFVMKNHAMYAPTIIISQ